MIKKKLSALLGIALTVAILVGIMLPIASAAAVTVEVLNPLGTFAIQNNQPLTSRDRFYDSEGKLDLNNKRIGLSAYGKVGNENANRALGALLKAEFPEVTIVNSTALGSPWNNKTDANYNTWAGVTGGANALDAVIFGVAD